MTRTASGRDLDVVFCGHGFERTGPPIYLLHLLGWLQRNTDIRPGNLALEDGPLRADFDRLGPTWVLGEPDAVRVRRGSRPLTAARLAWRRARLRDLRPHATLYVNTAWSVRALRYLPEHRGPVVSHIHELEVGLDYHLSESDRDLLFARTDHWVAASAAVADNLAARWGVARETIHVHHEMIDTSGIAAVDDGAARACRRQIGVADDAHLIGTAAVLNWRKAPDLFLEVVARLTRSRPELDIHAAWVGIDPSSVEVSRLRRDAHRAGIADRVHAVPANDHPDRWMRAFDQFVLPAREDAYPLACLEAAAAGRPVVCFDAGGMREFVQPGAGAVVDFPDVGAMVTAIAELAADRDRRRRAGEVARQRVVERHDVERAAPRLWGDLEGWVRR